MSNKKRRQINKTIDKSILASCSRDLPKHESKEFFDDLLFEQSIDCNSSDIDFINNEWLLFGDNQETLKILTSIVNNSHTTRSIIDVKSKMVLGDGFVPFESDNIPILATLRKSLKRLFVSDNSIVELNNLIGCVNTHNETLEEICIKIEWDKFAFGNSFIELVKTIKDGKEMVQINHIPLHQVALQKRNKESGKIEYIGVNCDWSNETNEIIKIPMYPKFEKVGNVERSAIHIKNYASGFTYWGLPSNIAGRFWSMIEYYIPKYNISSFENGFRPSVLAQFFGKMPESEAKAALKNFVDEFTGVGNNSKVYAQLLSDPKYAANLQVIDDNSDGKWIDLQKITTQGIIQANNWTTSLSGLATSGKLGNNQQMASEMDYVQNVVIKPERRYLLQKVVNVFIAENNKVNGGLFKGLMLDITNNKPIGLSAMIDPKQVLTSEEQREILGYESLENNKDVSQ